MSETCPVYLSVVLYTFTCLDVIMIIMVTRMLYKYCTYQNQQTDHKIPKPLYIIGILYFIISALCFITFGIYNASFCHLPKPFLFIIDILVNSFYSLQLLFLFLLLFVRTYYIFRSTDYEISRRSFITFISIYILAGISGALYNTHIIAWILALIFIIIISIYTPSVLIYKLMLLRKDTINITKDSVEHDMEFIPVIIKYMILTIWGIGGTFIILGIVVTSTTALDNIHISELIWTIGKFTHFATNYFCITFTYIFANKHYLLVCGCLDGLCRKCWKNDTNLAMTQLSSYSTKSKDTHTNIENELSSSPSPST